MMDSYAQMGGYIQQTLCNFWEEVINRYFESKGLTKFVGAATLRMKRMPTSSETDKENLRDTSVRLAGQVMSDIEGRDSQALTIYRTMLNRTDLNNDIIELLDEIIKQKQSEEQQMEREEEGEEVDEPDTIGGAEDEDTGEGDMLPPMGGILEDIAEGEEPVAEGPEGEADIRLPDMLRVVDLYDKARASIKRAKQIKKETNKIKE